MSRRREGTNRRRKEKAIKNLASIICGSISVQLLNNKSQKLGTQGY